MTHADFDPAQRFVAGTVGPPGQRAFFLQVRGLPGLVSVSLEKVQVSLLAERLGDLLDQVGAGPDGTPADNEALETPIEDEFRVSAIQLAWNPARSVVVIECHDQDPDDIDESAGQVVKTVRIVLSPPQAREFARRAASLVAAGRPPCPFCGQPLDPTGHICPRANGYRR